MNFEYRKNELENRFSTIQSKLAEQEVKVIKDALNQYYQRRDDILTVLSNIAGSESRDPQSNDFNARLRDGTKELLQILGDMIKNINVPSAEALGLRDVAVFEEARFWSSFQQLYNANARDELASRVQNLARYTDELNVKWESLSGEDRAIEQVERNATVRVNQIVDDAIAKARGSFQQLGQAVVDATDGVKSLKDATRQVIADVLKTAGAPDSTAEETAKNAVAATVALKDQLLKLILLGKGQQLDKFVSQLGQATFRFAEDFKASRDQQIAEYKAQLPNQNKILVIISNTRHEADEYIRNKGLDQAKDLYENARRTLESWASGLPTDGLKSDGAHFALNIVEGLGKLLNEMEKTFKDFLDKHKGRFFGDIDSEVVESLLEKRFWSDSINGLQSKGLLEGVRQWRSGLLELRPDLENAFVALQDNVAALPLEIQDDIRNEILSFQNELFEKLARQLEETNQYLNLMEGSADPARLKEDFDRTGLEETLRK